MQTLREGARGAEVEIVQLALRRAGFGVYPDGVFGPDTLRALTGFQAENGLAADGVAGPMTWAALRPYIVAPAGPIVPTDIRWGSELLGLVAEGLCRRYGFLKVTSVGASALGRPLYQLSIGKGARRVGYNAAHHANEWITTPVLLQFLERFAAGVAGGGEIGGVSCQYLYDRYTLDIVPMVNPDGVDLVNTGYIEAEAYTRAKEIAGDFPYIPFPSGWKANIDGVDPNLSYPAQWERARKLKFARGFDRPAPRDYVGEAPLAAPESAAMYRRALAADYRLILAYHSQGEIIYWKFDDFNPKGAYELGRKMEAVSGYTLAETPDYSGAAGYKDWFIQQFNRPGYTIEVGMGTNPLPLSQFDRIYQENVRILLLGMVGLE